MQTMSYRNNNFYHVYNRGVDSRIIFIEESDYVRFLHCLYEFNDEKAALRYNWLSKKEEILNLDKKNPRKLLVNIHCFCLMNNHFHLILEQITEGGITRFMRKLGTGYTMYFNEKYERSGALFQGKFKAILIDNDEYIMHLSRYIHLNPVDIIDSGWRKDGIKDAKYALDFLNKYRWSSFMDYIGINNFPSVTKREFIRNYFKQTKDYLKFINSILTENNLKEFSIINDIALEQTSIFGGETSEYVTAQGVPR